MSFIPTTLWQTGGRSLHIPSSPHISVSDPTSTKPVSQVKVAVFPYDVSVSVNMPLAGSSRIVHGATVQNFKTNKLRYVLYE